MKIEYSSNNSGGGWWLKDEHWLALEAAGWTVEWFANKDSDGLFASMRKEGRWLGALASRASKDFATPEAAIREFEKITGMDTTDEGCNCCGAPHSFSWDVEGSYGYASGDDIVPILYGNAAPKSLREAAERLSGDV